MKWNHLPMGGGLYNQNPELLDRFMDIFHAIGEEDRRKEVERKRDEGRTMQGGRRPTGPVHRP